MSDTIIRNNNSKKRLHPPSNNYSEGRKESSTGRKNYKPRGNKNDAGVSEYVDMEFHPRPSTGRPGSPHRYFHESFDVSFLKDSDGVKRDEHLEPFNRPRAETPSLTRASTPPPSMTSSEKILHSMNYQVVHRHLNGLCIITAGNVLENHKNQDDSIGIKSVKYTVHVGRDSKSAKGKIRARKHKKAKNTQGLQETGRDGIVSPQSSLCIVTLSNGKEIELKCCVAGTVIELNKRVGSGHDNDNECGIESDGGGNGANADMNVCAPKEENLDEIDLMIDTSLLMKDPLLDGYLAVILPRGVFPPSKSDQ